MAMRNLVDGDCGGPSALVKLNSHMTRDRSHRQSALRHVAGPARGLAESTDDQVVQEFLRETARPEARAPTSFRMSSLLQEMREIERSGARRPVTAPDVARLAADPGVWAQEFSHVQHAQGDQTAGGAPVAVNSPISAEDLAAPDHLATPGHLAGPAYMPVRWSADLIAGKQLNGVAANPLDEVQWLDQYKPSEDTELQKTAEQILGTVDDPSFSGSEFRNFLAKIRDGEVTLPDDPVVEAAGPGVAAADAAIIPDAEAAGPEVDSAGMSPRAREEFWARLEREWADLYKSDEHPWLSDYTDHFSMQEYKFEPDNRYAEDPDPLAEGQRRLAAGDLPGAVLCFEAAAQRQPDNPLAWQLLGTSLAENEQDPSAIVALRKCVELEPSCLKAYMALAASYTNESYPMQACSALREWLRHHSEYSGLVAPDSAPAQGSAFQASVVGGDIHDQVRDEYLAAARLRPSDPDPDVQCGLGVLLHMAGDYQRAIDCFNAALSVQPEVGVSSERTVWNKLGATFANGEQPERAVAAYRRALQLWPGFIRARFNLGISCRSLNAHREAAEHFLSALQHQAAGGRASTAGGGGTGRSSPVMSQSIWAMLRMTLATLGRSDLFTAADQRDLATLSREFGVETPAQ